MRRPGKPVRPPIPFTLRRWLSSHTGQTGPRSIRLAPEQSQGFKTPRDNRDKTGTRAHQSFVFMHLARVPQNFNLSWDKRERRGRIGDKKHLGFTQRDTLW